MKGKLIAAGAVAGIMGLASTGLALAANPGTTGQPNHSCEEQTTSLAGFTTDGFVNAQSVYAGSGSGSSHAGSPTAVSQYDVACFQLSSK